MGTTAIGLWRAKQDRVISVRLDVLLEILRALERFATEIALVRLKWHMDANVRGDVVALYSRSTTVAPLASQVQVVGTLATDMALAYMVLEKCELLIPNHVIVECDGRETRSHEDGVRTSHTGKVYASRGPLRRMTRVEVQCRTYTYVELLSGRAALATALPLADK